MSEQISTGPRTSGLTGAQLCFEGGGLCLDFRGKRGHFAFTDEELEPIRELTEDGVWDGFLAKLPNSELEAIRDFLNKWLPSSDLVPAALSDARFRDAEAARAVAAELKEALAETWRVLRAAGLLNLSNGVQLGATSWYAKAVAAEELSDAAIASAEAG